MNFLLKFSSKIIIYFFFYLIFNSYNSVNAYEVGEDFNSFFKQTFKQMLDDLTNPLIKILPKT
jgi:hypothetical protein